MDRHSEPVPSRFSKGSTQASLPASLIVCLTIAGCCRPTSSSVSREASATPLSERVLEIKSLSLAHDVGRVLTGAIVEHRFQIANHYACPIMVQSEADIVKSCGCTTLKLTKRDLAPGDSAEAVMRVNTQGKSGDFTVSALVEWTCSGQQRWPVHLLLQGKANPVLAAEPVHLQFSFDEVHGRVAKELELIGNLP